MDNLKFKVGLSLLLFSCNSFAVDSTVSNILTTVKNINIPLPTALGGSGYAQLHSGGSGEAGSSGLGCSNCRACFNSGDPYHATASTPFLMPTNTATNYYTVPLTGYYSITGNFVWTSTGGNYNPPQSLWVDLYGITAATETGLPGNYMRVFYTGDLGYQLISNNANFSLSGGGFFVKGSKIYMPRMWNDSDTYNNYRFCLDYDVYITLVTPISSP